MSTEQVQRTDMVFAVVVLSLSVAALVWVFIDLYGFWNALVSEHHPRGIRPAGIVIRLSLLVIAIVALLLPTAVVLKRRFTRHSFINAIGLADVSILLTLLTVIVAFLGFWAVMVLTGTAFSSS